MEPRKADIEAQHEGQHKLVEAHHTVIPFDAKGFFHQRLEVESFEQGGDRQQAAVGSQILAAEVIGRGSPYFIGCGALASRPCLTGLGELCCFRW